MTFLNDDLNEISAKLEPLILASASPRRRDILRRLGLSFEIRPSQVDEQEIPSEEPAALAERLSVSKARQVAQGVSRGTVIGSDTVVAVGRCSLGKPESARDACRILAYLSGKEQQVISGLCLIHRPTEIMLTGHDVTRVFTRPMSTRQIEDYVATGECFGKAGAYAIQETGDRFVDRIEGSFDNVVGFPTELFVTLILELMGAVGGERRTGTG